MTGVGVLKNRILRWFYSNQREEDVAQHLTSGCDQQPLVWTTMKTLARAVVLLALSASCLTAQRLQMRLVTSGYAWQRQDTVDQSSQHLFGYQTVQLSLAGTDLSFHTYLQGFNDFSGPLKNEGLVRLYNLYFKWTNIAQIGDISVGRQAIYAGVGSGTIDGGTAAVRLFDSRLKLLGYYGSLAAPQQKAKLISDAKDNYMTGAQVVGSPVEFAQLSVSYVNKHIQREAYVAMRRDSLFNPFPVEINPTASAEQYVSGDLNVDYNTLISAYLRYDYDLNLGKDARFQFFTRVKPFESLDVGFLKPLGFTAEYLQREPRLSFNSIFWVFAYNTLKDYELGGEYAITPVWQVFAKYGSVSYGDDDSKRVTVGANGDHVSISLTRNTGYAGQLSAASANFGYPLYQNKLMPTIMVSYARYKLGEGATQLDDALSLALGVVYRPIPVISFDTQAQWIQNKIYKNDLRLFLRVSYLFSQQLGIF